MISDARQIRPDHLRTPFSAEEIRIGPPEGRTIRSLVREGEGDSYVAVTRFVTKAMRTSPATPRAPIRSSGARRRTARA